MTGVAHPLLPSDLRPSIADTRCIAGAFGGTLYKYQDVFPWDCTVAYHKVAGICNTCSISKHVWVRLFDTA